MRRMSESHIMTVESPVYAECEGLTFADVHLSRRIVAGITVKADPRSTVHSPATPLLWISYFLCLNL